MKEEELKRQVLMMLEAMTNKTIPGHRAPDEDAWMRLIDGKSREEIDEMIRLMTIEIDKQEN